MAKNPFQQLDVLKKASQKGKQITDCYRLMYRKDLWVRAHDKLYPVNPPNDLQMREIDDIIFNLKKGIFRFFNYKESNRQSISYRERMVLEVLKMILTSLSSEPLFDNAHLNQSLKGIKANWNDQNWWIFGEFKNPVSSVWCNQILKMIENKIKDRRFLLLIHHAFFSGILDKEATKKGATLLSILYSILFQEMDLFLKGKMNEAKKANISIGKLKYFQRSNQYMVGFNGTKAEAVTVLNEVQLFFSTKLLCVNKEYSLNLSNLKKPVFLFGYLIKRCQQTNTLLFEIPDSIFKRLSKKYGDIVHFIPHPRPTLTNLTERTIMHVYHSELKKVVSDYRGANNWYELSKLFSLAKGSFIKTIAMKRKCSVRKVSLQMRSYKQGDLCIKVTDGGEVERYYPFIKLKQFSFLRY